MTMGKGKTASLLGISLSALLTACSEKAPTAAVDYPEIDSEGAQLLLEYCSTCHAPPSPSVHTAAHWPGVLERMQMRMSSKAQMVLKPQEFAVLLDYLQRHGAAVEPAKTN